MRWTSTVSGRRFQRSAFPGKENYPPTGARTDQAEPRLRSEIRQARKGQEEEQEVDRMNWWGKVIGTGVGMLGGPIGALAGAALGHLYDEDDPTPKNEQKARILYLAYFFSCAAKVSKADGGISAAELQATESMMERMGLNAKTRDFAKNVFRKAKVSRRSIDDDFKEAGRLIGYEPTVAQSFLGGLYEIVRSNGKKLNEMQVRYLLRGEERLKLRPGTI